MRLRAFKPRLSKSGILDGANRTNRWTGATGSELRIKRRPAKLVGSAVPRLTLPLCTFFMTVVKQILGHHVTFGGETHSGWLPPNAAVPKTTPTHEAELDITIEFDGAGYLLCWVSTDRVFVGDLWYQDFADAERAATENFGVTSDQWQTVV